MNILQKSNITDGEEGRADSAALAATTKNVEVKGMFHINYELLTDGMWKTNIKSQKTKQVVLG